MNVKVIKYNAIQWYYRTFKKKPLGVAMLHFGRCGSTVIGNLLEQNRNIKWDHELFELLKRGENKPFDAKYESDYLKILDNRYHRTNSPIYGFETKAIDTAHLSEEFLGIGIDKYINELIKLGFNRYIILRRNNYLKQLISVARGIKQNKWHYDVNEKVSNKPFIFDPQKVIYGNQITDLITHFKNFDRQYDLINSILKNSGVKKLELFYEEDIENDPKIAYNKICDFLSINKENVNVNLRKTQDLSFKEEIENYEEIYEFLEDTEYKWMLEHN